MKELTKKKIAGFLFIAGIVCTFLSGCSKDKSGDMPVIDCLVETTTAPINEINTLKQSLDSLGVLLPVQDSRGFFYKMDSTLVPDSGAHATPCSTVAITYSIARLGDTVFEKSDSVIAVSLPYTNVAGLKAALPLMKKGASMTLYLPPSLAYGSYGYKNIPGNTYLTFTIKLYDFSN